MVSKSDDELSWSREVLTKESRVEAIEVGYEDERCQHEQKHMAEQEIRTP